ncbi:MAG: serine/threonine protein kinase [Calothrix sp. C42_A2020_038]|nr:serine/threonine protein kinase [Calothrix sp. C42_A2020_038]
MLICQNPNCTNPFNRTDNKFCISCGSSNLGEFFRSRYRVHKVLGEGGFGKTYEAQDSDKLDAPCVIKQFVPQVQGTAALEKAATMFKEEAKRLYELGENHSQIPRLIAYFEQGKNLYLVQEFIPGNTLLTELYVQPFDEVRIRELLNDLLPVLQFVHEKNIIHRDIKPENIIRRQTDGKLVLIDFGGAKQVTQTTLARQGTGIYTIGYAPLEQMQGYACPASDLYALGVTCIRLITQQLPSQDSYGNLFDPLYDAMNAKWLWREHVKRQGVEISQELGRVLDKMIQHFVGERYQKVQDVLQDLNGTAPTVVSPTFPPTVISTNLGKASLVHIFSGHTNLVRSLAFGNEHLISAGNDKTIRFWKLQTRKLDGVLMEKGDWVVIATSSDGQILASGSSDKTIKVWEFSTGKPKFVLRGHFDLINSLSITPDSKMLVSSSRDRNIKIWNLNTGELLHTLSGHNGFVYATAISQDGQFIISGGSDKTVQVWKLATGERLQSILSSGFVRSVTVSSALNLIASGGYGKTINLWDLKSGRLVKQLEGHSGIVQSLAVSQDGQILVSGSDDQTAKVWDLQSGNLLNTLTGHTGAILAVDISLVKQTIATTGEDKTVRIWQVK